MSDTTRPAPGELSEEQAREYASKLRSAPVEQVVTEVLSSLLNLAQVKLGRRDARLLIDLTGLLVGHARPYLPDDVTDQLDQVLPQLRLAQVQAENAATGGGPEPNDLTEVPRPPAGTGERVAPEPAAPGPAPVPPPTASRLWVPGRDF
ncbi:MAG: hypothetical protein GEV12_04225 [Micromonosporaceae bacterium]|nr:hypothetical protein [Micromonosporaceae bacterium]